jgi:ADP-ribose pyrophosphatase YjhB (NUDIX family)
VSEKPRRRTDYWDDPHAPKPTSRKPSASVVLRNNRGEFLLLRRAGSGLWTIPTGALKKKETVTACAVRECREETGLTVELTGLVGVFSDPRHRIAYPDGEVRVPVNVCFYGQPVSGKLATDAESDEAAWVAPGDLDDYDIHPAIRRRISHALNGTVPHVDLTAAGREEWDAAGCWVPARGCCFPWWPGPTRYASRLWRAESALGPGEGPEGFRGNRALGGFPGSPGALQVSASGRCGAVCAAGAVHFPWSFTRRGPSLFSGGGRRGLGNMEPGP